MIRRADPSPALGTLAKNDNRAGPDIRAAHMNANGAIALDRRRRGHARPEMRGDAGGGRGRRDSETCAATATAYEEGGDSEIGAT